MSTEVTTLRESFEAGRALERSLTSVFPEVVSQVTAFLESARAPLEPAFEEKSYSLIRGVVNLDSLMPRFRNTLKHLRVEFGGWHHFFNATVAITFIVLTDSAPGTRSLLQGSGSVVAVSL
jgi:hypothetical protein